MSAFFNRQSLPYTPPGSEGNSGPNRTIKNLIWAYFWLVIFEGALRKWFLPGLATPLLVVRDPIVIAALALGFSSGVLRWNGWMTATSLIGIASLLLSLAVGHGNVFVALFGFRANFLHIPMIFLIGQALDRRDVEKMCYAIVAVGVGMIFLLALQFRSSPHAWVNVGIGGSGTSTFDAVDGYRRPSGLFSFSNGVALMYALVAACSLYGLIAAKKPALRLLALCGGLSVVAAVPLSISRTLLLAVLIVGIGGIIALATSGRRVSHIIQSLLAVLILATAASHLPGLEEPREAFMRRWEEATDKQGGIEKAIVGRVVEGAKQGVATSGRGADLIFGQGLGAGTNVGAQLLVGDRVFLVSEEEWGRLTGEMGWPLGMALIMLRVAMTIWLLSRAWKAGRKGDPLALIVWFACAHSIAQGQWGQPTSLGFAILGGGMVLAAAQHATEGFFRCRKEKTAPAMIAVPLSRTTPLPARTEPSTPAKGPSGNIW